MVDKMCKNKIDLVRIVGDTKRTPFCAQKDRRPDKRTAKVKPVYPFQLELKRKYENWSKHEIVNEERK